MRSILERLENLSESKKGFVIIKASRVYDGGDGYDGPSCKRAGIKGGTLYKTKKDAERDVKKLDTVNDVGWDVYPYRP